MDEEFIVQADGSVVHQDTVPVEEFIQRLDDLKTNKASIEARILSEQGDLKRVEDEIAKVEPTLTEIAKAAGFTSYGEYETSLKK